MLYKLINYQLNDQNKIVIGLEKLRDSAHFSTKQTTTKRRLRQNEENNNNKQTNKNTLNYN